ncbi:MAG: transcriptional regulator [Hydrogenovibrio crunogenus]|uniref:Putative transcriptional regulator n=1 Tax=Hydrogenovibrio crunogenus (strain DSM 25203 / XCL-2) TaxID=317025 RepID=Q31EI9_HYDCU|nr:transcriptional regulator [Hydrogenovibrio crunogenus]
MILLELKRYIKKHRSVSGQNIQNHFDISEETLEGLIRPLVEQGHIKEVQASGSGGCSTGTCQTGCSVTSQKEYFWTDKQHKSIHIPLEIH